jgi:hypothetical protein
MAKKKTKLKIAASKMASIAIAHLETLPENEAKAKIAAFHRFVAKSSRASQSAKHEKSSTQQKSAGLRRLSRSSA